MTEVVSAGVSNSKSIPVPPGLAKIKAKFVVPPIPKDKDDKRDQNKKDDGGDGQEPEVKKVKLEETGNEGGDSNKEEGNRYDRKKKEKPKGQNKHRPRPPKFLNENKLCFHYLDGKPEIECPKLPDCVFLHDIDKYLASKNDKLEGECFVYKTYGKCPRGLTCLLSDSHVRDGKNLVNEELWKVMQNEYEGLHRQLLDRDLQNSLRKRLFDFREVERIYSGSGNAAPGKVNENGNTAKEAPQEKTMGPITDADVIRLKVSEAKKIDWNDKLYLSPLTTVGNLPFRRLCVEMGADITCSEMSLATSLLQGHMSEYAMHRRHPSEKIWGVQLCASNGVICAKAAHALAEAGVDYDFVDLNTGCPLDPIYRQGAGSGLMCRTNKFNSLVKGMVKVMAAKDKAFTVKMRTGVKLDKYIAHGFIQHCKDSGVSAVTLHGRTREARYLRLADWNYIGKCAQIAQPMPLFGNGDVLSYEDYTQRKELSNVSGVMIGRGALIKPWVFQEIKEQRDIDLNSTQRMELIQKYVNYGLDHWGSDSQGVQTTRRFLLEWLSFFHRYIPHGILLEPPQHINQRPPRYVGRDEMETLLASPYSADWIKISEMFLGPVPEFFEFMPKHKANAWANQ